LCKISSSLVESFLSPWGPKIPILPLYGNRSYNSVRTNVLHYDVQLSNYHEIIRNRHVISLTVHESPQRQ